MAKVKRIVNGTWNTIGATPISTPIAIVTYDGIPLPDSIVAGDEVVLFNPEIKVSSSTTLQPSGISITVKKAGTYRFKWWVDAEGENCASQLYKNSTAVGVQYATDNKLENLYEDVACDVGDEIELYFKGSYDSYERQYYGACGGFCACIDWEGLRKVVYGEG